MEFVIDVLDAEIDSLKEAYKTESDIDKKIEYSSAILQCYKAKVKLANEEQQPTPPHCHIADISGLLPTGDEIWVKAQETSRFDFEDWFDGLIGNKR